MRLYLVLALLSLIFPIIHLWNHSGPKTFARGVRIFLLYQLVMSIGLAGILNFLGHLFRSDEIAHLIGWPEGNPFQYEVAVANLSYGILGLLCIWIQGHFWTATVIGNAIWLGGDGFVHLHEIIAKHNYAPGNAGLPFYIDFIIPIFTLILLMLHLINKESP